MEHAKPNCEGYQRRRREITVAQRGSAGYSEYKGEAPEGRHVSHTFSKNHQHIVFSTAGRRRTITKNIQRKVWAYMAGICRNHQLFVKTIGGMEDHVHLLIELPPSVSVAKAVQLVKSNSSKWLNEIGQDFAWQKGYAAFSVSASNIGAVNDYIRNQEQHHRRMAFEEELIALLKKHGVKYDFEDLFD